jgi:hypothetical protein
LIQREKIRDSNGALTEDREAMCRAVVEAGKVGKIEIVTSTFSMAEVSKPPAADGSDRANANIEAFFENDYILLVNVDKFVGDRARTLMRGGISGLKPPDATHLAAAAISDVEEMHTFDNRLLALDGTIDKADGTKLKICKPDPGGKTAPLLDMMNKPHEKPEDKDKPEET